ncbi:ankyrin [Gyrodon lividus]|nr:ankyrin [Gyrodon lividus]
MLLLDRGAMVDAIDKQKVTPLHYAAQFGNKDLARTLLQYGVNITLTDAWEYSPMMVALAGDGFSYSIGCSHLTGRCGVDTTKSLEIRAPGEKQLSVLQVLLEHQVNHVDKSAFDFLGLVFAITIAVATQNHALLRSLLEDGSKAGGKNPEELLVPTKDVSPTISASFKDLMTIALCKNDYTAMSLLVSAGANASFALEHAAAIGDEKAVRYLLTTGPNMEERAFTALYWASLGHLRVVQLLVEHGAKVSPPALLPLWELASDGPEEIMTYLLEHGADPNAMERKHPYTPLDWAVAYGRLGMMKLLLDSGANPNASRRHPIPALHIATMVENLDAVNLLLQYGVHPDKLADVKVKPPVRGGYGGTFVSCATSITMRTFTIQPPGSAFHLAAASGNIAMVQLFLQYNPDPTILNSASQTARQIAMANQHHELGAILEQYENSRSISKNRCSEL